MIKDRIEIIKGDITTIKTDAIVNAANTSLLGRGGVDGAIHRAGGPEILEACKKIISQIGRCETGEAVITTAGKLPSKYIIHTVGPVWNGGKHRETEKLISCYRSSLRIAREKGLKTIAFPNISTGVYHYPKDEAAAVAVNSTVDFLLENDLPEKVIFCCFDAENYNWMDYYFNKYLKGE